MDNPHLASLAEQAKVQDYVTDPRLLPIVRNVLRAAFEGDQPGVGELLAHIDDPGEQRRVHDAVFAGTFRDVERPQQMLDGCLYDCQRDRLKLYQRQLAARISQALERGEQQQARELSLERTAINRQLAELERRPPDLSTPGAHARQ